MRPVTHASSAPSSEARGDRSQPARVDADVVVNVGHHLAGCCVKPPIARDRYARPALAQHPDRGEALQPCQGTILVAHAVVDEQQLIGGIVETFERFEAAAQGLATLEPARDHHRDHRLARRTLRRGASNARTHIGARRLDVRRKLLMAERVALAGKRHLQQVHGPSIAAQEEPRGRVAAAIRVQRRYLAVADARRR